MVIRILRFAAACALFTGLAAHGQMPMVPGEPAAGPKAVPRAQLRLPAEKAVPAATLPPVSEAEVASVRHANRRGSAKEPLERVQRVVIGLVRPVAGVAEPPRGEPLRWTPVEGGLAARLAVTSPDAGSLRLALDLAGVPEDVEMVFFGSEATARLEGPVRVGDVRDRTQPWWSPLTEGSTQTVELFVPARRAAPATPPRVVDASHVFTTPSSRFAKRLEDIGRAGACNVDVPCSPLDTSSAFQNVADSTAQMVFIDGAFTTLCTGTLLADGDPASQVPWFYSANHCFENASPPYKTPSQMQAVASTLTTLWGFEASACNSGTPSASWSQLGGGAAFLYNNVQLDALFMRLNGLPPAGSYYSGWDANPVVPGSSALTIHHPQGDLKKVTQGSIVGFSTPGVGGGSQSFIEMLWSSGTTEQGSSGAGLWTSNGGQYYFRGSLWGGTALCSNPSGTDNYSRFDQVFPALATYLGSKVSPAVDYSDLWWGGPGESGWGLSLIQHPSRIIFGVWYTYEPDGTRTWYFIPSGSWTSTNTYAGPLYTTNGPDYAGPFDPSLVQARHVGNATITFTDANNGTFAYSVDGVSGTKSITRQPF